MLQEKQKKSANEEWLAKIAIYSKVTAAYAGGGYFFTEGPEKFNKKASAQGMSKISGVFASFHEAKCAAVARLSEGEARVSKPQAHKSME